jgi:hypothetical protein
MPVGVSRLSMIAPKRWLAMLAALSICWAVFLVPGNC